MPKIPSAPIFRPSPSDRRDFFKKASAVVVGALTGLVPMLSGLLMALDPLRSRSHSGRTVRVTSLNAVPADGMPRKFPIIASRTDVWNRTPAVPIGAVYLRRNGPSSVQAFNVVCPHAGCPVDFLTKQKSYLCPCHNSTFALDGRVSDPKSPSPRGLDELRVEIRDGGEIWVEFQNFLTGHADKVPQV